MQFGACSFSSIELTGDEEERNIQMHSREAEYVGQGRKPLRGCESQVVVSSKPRPLMSGSPVHGEGNLMSSYLRIFVFVVAAAEILSTQAGAQQRRGPSTPQERA